MLVNGEVFYGFNNRRIYFKDYLFPLNYQQKTLHTYDTDSYNDDDDGLTRLL